MTSPTARDLMTDRVLTVQADWSVQELAAFLTEHSISGAPVVSDYGGAIGVVSLTDLARHDSDPSASDDTDDTESPPAFYLGDAVVHEEANLDALQQQSGTTVRDLMMPTIFTVEEDTPIHEIARRMVQGQLHRLLVVRAGTERKVVGLVSAIDVLEWVQAQGESVADSS